MSPHTRSLRVGMIAGALATVFALGACNRTATPPATADVAPAPDAKHAYSIRGELPGLADGTEVKLLTPILSTDPSRSEPLATAKVQGGRFVLAGNVQQPVPAVLSLGGSRVVRLVLEPGEQRIMEGALGPVAKGGALTAGVYGYLENPDYIAAFKANREANDTAFKGVDMEDEAGMKAARKAIQPAFAKLSQVKNDYDRAILDDGQASPLLKLLVLSENYDWKRYDETRRAQMIAEYKKTLGEHPLIVALEHNAAENRKNQQLAEKFAAGKKYADIQAVDSAGKVVKLSDALARNKLVLLDFWASWCGPCRGEFPHLQKVYQEFHDAGFEIYAVSLDDDKSEWGKAMREESSKGNALPWINLIDPGMDGKAARAYGVEKLPQNYLIASNGDIVGTGMREWDIERTVRAQLGKAGDAR